MHSTLTIILSGQTLTRLAPHGLGPVSRKSQNGTIIQLIHNLHAQAIGLMGRRCTVPEVFGDPCHDGGWGGGPPKFLSLRTQLLSLRT